MSRAPVMVGPTGAPTLDVVCEDAHVTRILHWSSAMPDTKGVVMFPQLNIDPSQYVIPLLHLLIELVNKAWSSMLLFFDEFVENVSPKQALYKDRIAKLEELIAAVDDEVNILTVNKSMAYEEIHNNCSDNNCIKKTHLNHLFTC